MYKSGNSFLLPYEEKFVQEKKVGHQYIFILKATKGSVFLKTLTRKVFK